VLPVNVSVDGVAQRPEEKPVSAGFLWKILLEGEVAAAIGVETLVETQLRAAL
jgi:hypothetical protein